MNDNTNMSFLPREMLKWLNSLDLAYQIRNVRRDLANGFVVAEMLQRYYPKEVNIFTFYNGYGLNQKKDNWQRISELLNKKGFNMQQENYMPILHIAPNAALEFIIRLYQFLTNRKVDKQWTERAFKNNSNQEPNYLKKTAAYISKDREITRIQDQVVQKKVLEQTLIQHEITSKQERQDMNLTEYIQQKKKQELIEQKRLQEMESLKQQQTELQNVPEIKEIPIKTFNNDRNNKKQEIIVEGREITDLVSKVCKQQFDQQPLSEQIADCKLEDNENKVVFLFNNILEFDKKSVKYIILVLIENMSQIVEIISNNYSEFRVFFKFILEGLEAINYEWKAYRLLIQFLQNLGNQLMKIDGQSTQMFFENICLQRLLDILTRYQNKRLKIIEVINSYCMQDSSSKLRIIKKSKEIFKNNIQNFLGFLSYFVENGFELEIDDEFYNLILYYSMIGLESPSAITRTRGLKLINEIIHVNYKPILNLINKFSRFTQDNWWECRAQLLILSAQLLIYLANENSNNMFDQQSEIKEQTEDQNQVQEEKKDDIDSRNVQRKENQEYLLSLIYELFQVNSNENILRIGLVYLSPVTNYYQQLCDRYLEIMLNINETIRQNVLITTPQNGQDEGQIVSGCNTFKYKLTGVCLNWNCCGIANSLDKFIKNQAQFDNFEKDHMEIIMGCMVNKLNEEESEQWLQIYENLKEYLFLSLCEKELCKLGSDILKKFMTFEKITDQILVSSEEVLFNILSLIYHPDSNENCQGNLLDLFKYLSEQANFFKEYIYNIVKNFSEKNKPYFLRSNLTLFMNELSHQRRNG